MKTELAHMFITLKASTQSWEETTNDLLEALKEFKLHDYPQSREDNNVLMELGLAMAVFTSKLKSYGKSPAEALKETLEDSEMFDLVEKARKEMFNIKKDL